MVDLLESLMCEPLFNELRTKQQLGYTVDCSARNTHGLLGFMIRSSDTITDFPSSTSFSSTPRLTYVSGLTYRVQSSSKNPQYLAGAVEDFVVNFFVPYLQDMPHARFLEHRASLQASKMHKDLCLADETNRIWEEIWEGRYAFDAKIEEAQALSEITKEDILQVVKFFLISSGGGYRHLSTRIFVVSERESLNGTEKASGPLSGLITMRSRLHNQPTYWADLSGRSKSKMIELSIVPHDSCAHRGSNMY